MRKFLYLYKNINFFYTNSIIINNGPNMPIGKYSTFISISLFLIIFIIILLSILYTKTVAQQPQRIISPAAMDYKQILILFSTKPGEIDTLATNALKKIENAIILMHENKNKTFENTILFFDYLDGLSDAGILANVFEVMALLHPDQKTREAALGAKLKIAGYSIEHITNNPVLYNAIVDCYQTIKTTEITETRKYCIEKIIENFERSGIQLPEERRRKLNVLFQDSQKYQAELDQNISTMVTTVEVTKEALDGLSEDFVASLSKSPSDLYILTLDYPVYFTVMENCTNQETRKRMYRAFNNRGYPENDTILSELITTRTEIAQALGYKTYADYNIANQMAKSYTTVVHFLNDLLARLETKLTKEYEILEKEASELGISLSPDNKFYPWDIAFISNSYKKRNFNLDEVKIAEYFPLQHTVPALLELYESFFDITFEKITPEIPLYDQDVMLFRVREKNGNKALGHIILDLHPRPNKYSHAAHASLVPNVSFDDATSTDYISVVIANFPKETKTQPSLLKRDDVNTFFHELGHALHSLFGKTEISTFSGTHTKQDFVEMPSQMLEEWLYDKTVLKKISRHYKTGESLPNTTIEQILRSKNIFSAFSTCRQILLAFLSLTYYNTKEKVQLFETFKNLQATLMPRIWFDSENHSYASFGHLGEYGARYYGYLYSKVFALDIFSVIKSHGLSNPAIGKKYCKTILAKGGSEDPEVMLIKFLGRKPSIQAFIDDLLAD